MSRVASWIGQHRAVAVCFAAVLLLALGGGAFAVGFSSGRGPEASVVEPDAGTAARVTPETPAGSTRARTCVIDTRDPAFATLAASVVDMATGEQLYARGDGEPAPTLSLQKLITGAVALHVIGPETRIMTRVYEGTVKGSVVIVGGGDPTLSATPAGAESVYEGASKMGDLAAQVKASLDRLYPGEQSGRGNDDDDDEDDERGGRGPQRPSGPDWEITQVIVDAGLWSSADAWDPAWPSDAGAVGTQAKIVPLMIDGDRRDPALATSPRGEDPVAAATDAFISALALRSSPQVTTGGAITDRALLGEVASQPISVLVKQMIHLDDDTLAEMLARLSSKIIGSDGSAASLQQMYQSVLTEFSIPTDGLVVKDGSGLNPETAADPEFLSRLLALAASGEPILTHLHAALPVAGVSGPLLHRFSGDFSAVHSQFGGTGSTTDAATVLGGLLTAADGTVLALSLQATDGVTSATGLALEAFVAGVHACGGNLADADPAPTA